MLDSTARIFDLIRAIKDYSYMDQMPIQEVDVPQSLENTLAMVASRLRKVEVVRDYEPNLPCVSAYGRELNQVWTALIENALDAVQDKGEIKLVVRTAGDMLLVEIWDNGPGIPAELQARIFEPFFTTKAPGSGLGLGLDVVSRIVRMHRGYVTVQSKPGEHVLPGPAALAAGAGLLDRLLRESSGINSEHRQPRGFDSGTRITVRGLRLRENSSTLRSQLTVATCSHLAFLPSSLNCREPTTNCVGFTSCLVWCGRRIRWSAYRLPNRIADASAFWWCCPQFADL